MTDDRSRLARRPCGSLFLLLVAVPGVLAATGAHLVWDGSYYLFNILDRGVRRSSPTAASPSPCCRHRSS